MLLAISGPSGVGKSRLMELASSSFGFSRAVPLTTRPARTGEIPGVDYEFVSKDRFRQLIRHGDLMCWDFTLRHYYGYRKEVGQRLRLGQNVVIQILARMAVRLANTYGDVFLVFLDASSDAILTERLSTRGYGQDELLLRTLHWEEEREHSQMFDVIVADADHALDPELTAVLADIIERFQ